MAEWLYRRVMNLDPADPAAPFNLGNALRSSGRDLEAEAAFRAAVGADPNFALDRFIPFIIERTQVDLGRLKVSTDKRDPDTMPVYFKSRFMPADDPGRDRQLAFEATMAGTGLFEPVVNLVSDLRHYSWAAGTFIRFTCSLRGALAANMSKYQCLRVLIAGPNRFENRLYLTNVGPGAPERKATELLTLF